MPAGNRSNSNNNSHPWQWRLLFILSLFSAAAQADSSNDDGLAEENHRQQDALETPETETEPDSQKQQQRQRQLQISYQVEFFVQFDLWPIDMTFTIFQHRGSVFEDTQGTPIYSDGGVLKNGTLLSPTSNYTWLLDLAAPSNYALQLYDAFEDGMNTTTDASFAMSRQGVAFIDSNAPRFNPPGVDYGKQTPKMWFFLDTRGGVTLIDPVRVIPTNAPASASPTGTVVVTPSPTATPTQSPTQSPTASPTDNPTHSPTASPSDQPTAAPTTLQPTTSPTDNPTEQACNLCFLLSPLSFDMAQSVAADAGCNLASLERREYQGIVATEIEDFLLNDKYWVGGTKYPPTSECSEQRMLQQQQRQQQQQACPSPLQGASIPVIVEVETGVFRDSQSRTRPLLSFYPIVSPGTRPIPTVVTFTGFLPDIGQRQQYLFELGPGFRCGIERIDVVANPEDRANTDSWLLADFKVTFDSKTYTLDLNKVGRPGIWLDAQPYDPPGFYGRFPVDDHWELDCNDCTGSTGEEQEDAWMWLDETPFSDDLWALGQPNNASERSALGRVGYTAVGRNKTTGDIVLYDEAASASLPSVWSCCDKECPEVL